MHRQRILRCALGQAIVMVAAAALGCTLPGCSTQAPGRLCTAEFVPGIVIRVVDAETEQPAACGTVGTLTAAGYSATLDSACDWDPQDAYLRGAWERPGEYAVSLQRPGYETWHSARIRVIADECHVHTVELEARLQRTTGNPAR